MEMEKDVFLDIELYSLHKSNCMGLCLWPWLFMFT